MGMYTELNCAFELMKDTPDAVIAILKHMLDQRNPLPARMPSHPFFRTERWDMIFTCSSYYFAACRAQTDMWLDEVDRRYHVMIRANLKNYDGEIGKFIDWITSYIDALEGDFIGYSRYEDTETPTLIYHPNRFFTPKVPFEIAFEEITDAVKGNLA
jgi:hypothetical protein